MFHFTVLGGEIKCRNSTKGKAFLLIDPKCQVIGGLQICTKFILMKLEEMPTKMVLLLDMMRILLNYSLLLGWMN